MGFADFSQFVVTTAYETACETSTLKVHALSPHLSAASTLTSGNLFGLHCFWPTYPYFRALYAVPVRRTKGLPTASFGFHLTMDTLAVQLCTSLLPTRTRDFHPLERAHGAQTKKTPTDNPIGGLYVFPINTALSSGAVRSVGCQAAGVIAL